MSVAAVADGLRISPVTDAAAPVVMAEDMRDLGAAVGLRVVVALGGSAELAGETLVLRFDAPRPG